MWLLSSFSHSVSHKGDRCLLPNRQNWAFRFHNDLEGS